MLDKYYDVIIAGCGVAGLHAALSLDRKFRILVLAKGETDLCNTALAQGGVAAVLNPDEDDGELHYRDTLKAGGGVNSPEAVRVLVKEGPERVLGLLKYGVDFDRRTDGKLDLTLEGGHSRRRIAHHRDTTGFEIEKKLLAAAGERENIRIAGHSVLLKLLYSEEGFTAGILRDGRLETVRSGYFFMATGGVGRVFRFTTNSAVATGDGIVLASKLGARVKNLRYVQFHPTAFAGEKTQQRFLISESVRGEGAVLLNCNGERFMRNYDPRGELAPRDVVSAGILKETRRTGSEAFYLDIRHKPPEFVKNRFPGIYEKCLTLGVDITRDRIPVYPCQHYLMGGIDVDTYARTNIPGLYALGECSHTGVHGKNRLASNSLLEALVFSKRAADDIMGKSGISRPFTGADLAVHGGTEVPEGLKDEIRGLVQKSFFILPDADAARKSLPRISEIQKELESGRYADGESLLETCSLAGIARLTLEEVVSHEAP